MRNYFINHTPVRETGLREAEVPFELFTISRQKGFLISEADLQRALDAIQSRSEGSTPSAYDGIDVLNVRRITAAEAAPPELSEAASDGSIRITTETWKKGYYEDERESAKRKRQVFKVLREYAPRLGVSDIVVVAHNERDYYEVPRTTPNKFFVYFWCAPSGSARDPIRESVFWGLSAGRPWSAWRHTGLGVRIEDDNEQVVGELVGNNLYILEALQFVEYQNAIPILRHILDEVVFQRTATEEERAQRTRERALQLRPKFREAYVAACGGRFKKTIDSTKVAISTGKQKVDQLTKDLVTAIRETAGAERKLEQLEAVGPSTFETYGLEFDRLVEIPKIRDVRVDNGVIKVFTDILYCVDPRTSIRHEIGAFRIDISIHGSVQWHNLTRKVDGYKGQMNAPHIWNNGTACLGNMAEIIPDLIGRYEFAALAMVCIQFVESVNVDDPAGKMISNWPVAQSAGTPVQEAA
ncbi:MAG TPA: hypothetical protein VEB18_01850 [Candidatus Paceibacterota bacterium]|nr:hypothetical protein [Candidatus Paceibacterota bacterium]